VDWSEDAGDAGESEVGFISVGADEAGGGDTPLIDGGVSLVPDERYGDEDGVTEGGFDETKEGVGQVSSYRESGACTSKGNHPAHVIARPLSALLGLLLLFGFGLSQSTCDTPYLDALIDAVLGDAISLDLKIASTSHGVVQIFPRFIDAALRLASGGSSCPDDDALLHDAWAQIQASF